MEVGARRRPGSSSLLSKYSDPISSEKNKEVLEIEYETTDFKMENK
jgi:hypothetical protein